MVPRWIGGSLPTRDNAPLGHGATLSLLERSKTGEKKRQSRRKKSRLLAATISQFNANLPEIAFPPARPLRKFRKTRLYSIMIAMDSRMLKVHCRAVLIAFLATGISVHGQEAAKDELRKILTEEAERWSLLTYSQLYPYGKSEPVQYTGTLYLRISSSSLEECNWKISIVVQDRYVGSEEKRQGFSGRTVHKETGPKSDSYRYSYHVSLRDIDPEQVRAIRTRPAQLLENTSLSCKEEKACNLLWLQVVTKKPAVSEIRFMNGFQDVNQIATQMVIPMTSDSVASQTIKALQDATSACHGT
jgi:hypothetical protein